MWCAVKPDRKVVKIDIRDKEKYRSREEKGREYKKIGKLSPSEAKQAEAALAEARAELQVERSWRTEWTEDHGKAETRAWDDAKSEAWEQWKDRGAQFEPFDVNLCHPLL